MASDAAARIADAGEALAALADAPYRIARRTDDNPVTLGQLAAQVTSLRDRVERGAGWMATNRPCLGGLFEIVRSIVDEYLDSRLQEALRPDLLAGPERTATGRFDTPGHVRRAIELWRRSARLHRLPDRTLTVLTRVSGTAPNRLSALAGGRNQAAAS